ncbi:hypothetical protein C6497_02905 [Candidatus Poribacteria bacterium]|nr:MAG: hypothetical protein C6497_02905 [Candidatus Poribacteria bacterium]
MKDNYAKCYDIVTFSIKFNTFWIRKYIDMSQKKTLRYTVKPCSEIQLTDNQQLTTISYKLIIANIILTYVKNQIKNRNNTKSENA